MSSGSHLQTTTQRSTLFSQERDLLSTYEDTRTRFYEKYRHEAEEYNRELIKKYDEDMNTTLIFVGFLHVPQAWTC